MTFQIKRIYEVASPQDGKRVLVDHLWPRGVSKEKAALDLWLKEIAPSPELRIWFNHQEDHFKLFREKYLNELDHDPNKQESIQNLISLGKDNLVTLLYGAKSPTINHAIVLLEFLNKKNK